MSSIAIFVFSVTLIEFSDSIGCFVCTSIGGSNPSCEDTFHYNSTDIVYQSPCLTGRKGRDGLFPGSSCIKLAGTLASGGSLMTRGCSVDSGSATADTELVRISHCGAFYLDNKYVSGCVMSCQDHDGCNSAPLQGLCLSLLSLSLLRLIGISKLH